MLRIKTNGRDLNRKIDRLVGEMPAESTAAIKLGMEALRNMTAKYPAQRAPANPKRMYIRGVGTRYLPTGRTYMTSQKYGASQEVRAEADKSGARGYLDFKADYSNWIRGDLEGKGQARVHADNWELLSVIFKRWLGTVTKLLDATFERLFRRNQ